MSNVLIASDDKPKLDKYYEILSKISKVKLFKAGTRADVIDNATRNVHDYIFLDFSAKNTCAYLLKAIRYNTDNEDARIVIMSQLCISELVSPAEVSSHCNTTARLQENLLAAFTKFSLYTNGAPASRQHRDILAIFNLTSLVSNFEQDRWFEALRSLNKSVEIDLDWLRPESQ